jgi:hypothetical protein
MARVSLCSALAALALLACSRPAGVPAAGGSAEAVATPQARPSAPRVTVLETPAAPGSGESSLALAPDGRLFLTWIEPRARKGHVLRYASRRPGEAWSGARAIAEGGNWFVNWADFPALAGLPEGGFFAHWLQKRPGGAYAYDVRVTRSRDGRTWGPSLVPHRDGRAAEHGFVSFVPAGGGRMGMVWLDGRETLEPAPGKPRGAMTLRYASLGVRGGVADEAVLDPRVCDCCQTAAAATARGLVVAYRDRSEKEVRDIAVVRRADGAWSAPQVVGSDGWEISGCPVNGPALAAEGDRVALAWFTAAREQPRVKAAFSRDAGATWGSPIIVDDGRPIGRVDVALLASGEALVSWMEQVGAGAEIRVRRVSADGAWGDSLRVADSSSARSSGFPRLRRQAQEIVVAWRDASEPSRVRTAVMPATGW